MPKITFYEDELYKRDKQEESTIKIVSFRLAQEWYGVEIIHIKEVIKVGEIAYLPFGPEYISGLINLRGNIVSVTNLKRIFNLPEEAIAENSRLIVVEYSGLETAILTDEISRVTDVPIGKIDPTLSTIPPGRAAYIDGECKIGDKLIAILKVEMALNVEKKDKKQGGGDALS
ncbi:MAG: chemotaxis protein CheW [Candidatus Omnitrophota bacterium]